VALSLYRTTKVTAAIAAVGAAIKTDSTVAAARKKQLMPLLDAGSSMLQRQPQTPPIIRRYFRICSGVEIWQFVSSVKSVLDRQWQDQWEFSLWRVSVVPYSPILGLQIQVNQALVPQEQIDSAPHS